MRTREDGRDAMDNELRVGDLNFLRAAGPAPAAPAWPFQVRWRGASLARARRPRRYRCLSRRASSRPSYTGARELSGIPVYANRYIYSARSRVHHRKPQSQQARRRLTNSPNASWAMNVCTTRVFVRLQYGHCIHYSSQSRASCNAINARAAACANGCRRVSVSSRAPQRHAT